MAEKNKKDKPTYVDDRRPLADMSGIDAGLGRFSAPRALQPAHSAIAGTPIGARCV